MAWQYNKRLRRYQDKETGRILSVTQQRALHQQFIDSQVKLTDEIARRLAAKEITIQQAELLFRERIKTVFVDEYALGIGGRGMMDFSDYGRLGAMIREQYQYAHILFTEIANGEHSEAMIRYRFGNYLQSGGAAFERARALSYGLELPTYPRDGTQACHQNCRCHWTIEETETEWRATWVQGSGDSCETCSTNATRYAPLVVNKSSRAVA